MKTGINPYSWPYPTGEWSPAGISPELEFGTFHPGHFPLEHILPDISPARTIPLLFVFVCVLFCSFFSYCISVFVLLCFCALCFVLYWYCHYYHGRPARWITPFWQPAYSLLTHYILFMPNKLSCCFLHGVGHFSLPPPPCANLYKPIYRNWKLALIRIPIPNPPTTWGTNPNLN